MVDEQTAAHESGHATTGVIFFPDRILSASIVPNEEYFGVVHIASSGTCRYSQKDFLNLFTIDLAGHAAETLLGFPCDGGCRDDGQDFLADVRTCRTAFPQFRHSDTELQRQALGRAANTLTRERSLFNAIMAALLKKRILIRDEILTLRDEFATSRSRLP